MNVRLAVLVTLLAASACDADTAVAPAIDGGSTSDAATWVQLQPELLQGNKVDILFMIDDSGSMQPKQAALRTRFPALIEQLDTFAAAGHPASYHIGVVTSDLGAPGINCPYNLGGKLQAIGAAATAGCLGPANGDHYLVYDQVTPANDNTPGGQTLAQTFTCMAEVTSDDDSHIGCGFESQLEAVYKALHDPIAENVGFLRDDALLVVVWLTDEDDCSASQDTDLFSNMTEYGPQNSYKCTRFGIKCDGTFPLPATPDSSFASCVPATPSDGSQLTDIEKYIDYFTKPASQGGVKPDPHRVVLVAIDAPAAPFETSMSTDSSICGAGVASCTVLDHSCTAAPPDDTTFFGDPAVRINTVVSAAQNHQLASICGTDYTDPIIGLGAQIDDALQSSCVPALLTSVDAPNCIVQQVDESGSTTPIPACDASHSVIPCWSIVAATSCPTVFVCGQSQQLALQIDRGSVDGQPTPLPDGTYTSASCQVVPTSALGSCP